MGYPLTGYLFSEFQLVDVDEFAPDTELYLVKADGRYRIVRDLANFDVEEEEYLDPDEGVWAVQPADRLFAFRIQKEGIDLVASLRTAVADVRTVFGADLTDGVERLVDYFRGLPLFGPADLRVGGGQDADTLFEGTNELHLELAQTPPDLPGMRVAVQGVQLYEEWCENPSGELIDVSK